MVQQKLSALKNWQLFIVVSFNFYFTPRRSHNDST